jgi:hypothetical protein
VDGELGYLRWIRSRQWPRQGIDTMRVCDTGTTGVMLERQLANPTSQTAYVCLKRAEMFHVGLPSSIRKR